jgi:hypothetical protein
VHVDAVGAAIDLRSAHLHQMNEAVLKAACGKILFQSIHRLLRFLGVSTGINSRFHE